MHMIEVVEISSGKVIQSEPHPGPEHRAAQEADTILDSYTGAGFLKGYYARIVDDNGKSLVISAWPHDGAEASTMRAMASAH